MLRIIMTVIPSLLSYYFYNYQFFRYADNIFESKNRKNHTYFLTFLINYTLFVLVTIWSFHLIVNWSIFLAMLFIQIMVIYRTTWLNSFFMALICALVGLANNVLFRCSLAIMMNQPLSVFDNNMVDSDNLKKYPLLICFFLTGALFLYLRKSAYGAKLKQMIKDRHSMVFYTVIMSVLYGFLVLNLLAYYTKGNNLFTKLWGIKSVLLVIFCLYVGYQYTLRLNEFRQNQREYGHAQQALLNQKVEEEKINRLAFFDPLTGYYNRHYAEELFSAISEKSIDFVVCFADLDGLKIVNDRMGHLKGDNYLSKAAELMKHNFQDITNMLIRFGGDEFLVIVKSQDVISIKKRIEKTAAELKIAGEEENCMFSISYGIADSSEAESIRDVVALADKRMYEQKHSIRRK